MFCTRLVPLVLFACTPGAARVATLAIDASPVTNPPDGLLEETKVASEDVGGVLWVWQDREAAEDGLEALGLDHREVTWLELPVEMVDSAETPSVEPYVTIVRVPAPWYATRGMIVRRMRRAVPEYEALDGLIRKDFVLTDDRQLGGLYRWASREAADAFFDDLWHADIEDRYGVPADLLEFDAVDPEW
ncbi:MAG: hypothetical protein AAF602_01315 [Myxococcota bacterium]